MAGKSSSVALQALREIQAALKGENLLSCAKIDRLLTQARKEAAGNKKLIKILNSVEFAYRTQLHRLGSLKSILESALANRNRKSAPETVLRNVEICDLRKKNKTFWTLGRLGGKYKLKRQSIVRILREEEKWRQLSKVRV